MGPLNKEFVEMNGDCWRTGRIDIEDDTPYGSEVLVPMMHKDSWFALSEWLWTYESQTADFGIIETFERKTGHKIKWFREDN
jgi:hypothetical protein